MCSQYQRPEAKTLHDRLRELPRFLVIVAGPRQVGKTTLVRRVLENYPPDRSSFIAIDSPNDFLVDVTETTAP